MKTTLMAATVLVSLLFFSIGSAQEPGRNSAIINADQGKLTISRHIYGHFAEHLGQCIYGGIWVGENSPIPNVRGIRQDVVAALRRLQIPNLRWPGGCFADTYHWMDGIGPREKRPSIVNTHWGGVTENNHFGTHEFMDLCEQLGTEPYITAECRQRDRARDGTVDRISDARRQEPDGRSAARERAREALAGQFLGTRQRDLGLRRQHAPRILCRCPAPIPELPAQLWRQPVVQNRLRRQRQQLRVDGRAHARDRADDPWAEPALLHRGLGEQGLRNSVYRAEWFKVLKKTLGMADLIGRHSTIMDRYDPGKRVGLVVDEWGTWYDVEPGTNPGFLYQQNTLRDALVAGINLNIFNNTLRTRAHDQHRADDQCAAGRDIDQG